MDQLNFNESMSLANKLQLENNFDESVKLLKQIQSQFPNFPIVSFYIAVSFYQLKKYTQADELFEYCFHQGIEKLQCAKYISEIKLSFRDLTTVASYLDYIYINDPENIKYTLDLVKVLTFHKKIEHALQIVSTFIIKNPEYIDARFLKCEILKKVGRLDLAELELRSVLDKNPNQTDALINLANVYCSMGRIGECIKLSKRVIKLENRIEGYINLCVALMDGGHIKNALKFYTKAFTFFTIEDVGFKLLWDNFLCCLNYAHWLSRDKISKWHQKFGEIFTPIENQPIVPKISTQRKIKIGLLSADFNNHSVSYFVEAVLKNVSIEIFEIVCFYNSDAFDLKTNHLKSSYNHLWKHIVHTSTELAIKIIQAEEIDILFDLGGHTAGNRLDIFTRRVAPIQISWIGYCNDTGVKNIDFRIVDTVTDPQNSPPSLIKLPGCFLCYTPFYSIPIITRVSNYIIFGAFVNASKINVKVIETWAEILRKLPQSKLLLKCKSFLCPSIKQKFESLFQKESVLQQVVMLPQTISSEDHLHKYNEVDISLDTFPYSGTTTTCESLYMGVPMLTLSGNCHAHNVSKSILLASGMDGYAASSKSEYIQKAVNIGTKIQVLPNKEEIRNKFIQSDMCNGKKFTSKLEKTLMDLITLYNR
jgi:predicted O-linked N-acetylglucosamine transferase (SPINDLY family)